MEPEAKKAVERLVRWVLPGPVRLGEVDVDAGELFERRGAGHLAPLVQVRVRQLLGDPVEALDEAGEHALGPVVLARSPRRLNRLARALGVTTAERPRLR